MEVRGFIIQASYRVREERPVVQLYGRAEGGPAFLVEDDRERPYFFVRACYADRVRGEEGCALHATPLVDLSGQAMLRVVAPVPAAIPPLRARLERDRVPAAEADIRFAHRFLIDRGIGSVARIRGRAGHRHDGLLHFHNPELVPDRFQPELRTLSIDLETTPDASEIFSIALASEDLREVHLVSPRPVRGALVYASEAELLSASLARIRDIDPDLIVGWNVVDFDLRVLERRCRDLRVPAVLGRSDERMSFRQDRAGRRAMRVSIPGRAVLDGIPLVREALRLPDYRLETVARCVLGRGKKIDHEAPDAAAEILRLYRDDPEALVAYNLEDAVLVLEILAREGLLALSIERSLLSGLPLDRIGASVASFDRLYLPRLRQRGAVAPSVGGKRDGVPLMGGAVLDSVPGLFRNVAVFDFKSLYPSLMRTFHLDPLAHARAAGECDALEAPNGARFSRREAILPELIEQLMDRRERARRAGDRHADRAIKIMMNSLYGVMGSPGCRFFDPDIANAITGFGQQTLAWTREAFQARGVRVIYGDTDSIFVSLGAEATPSDAKREAERLRGAVDAEIADRIRSAYRVEPRLSLELERLFERFFMPRVRGGASGSKKRYAGLCAGELAIVGLEAVRRDWPPVAGRLQRGLLSRVFADRPTLPFVREVAHAVRCGDLDAELVYARRIRKASLERYTAITPPHIQAARKAGAALGRSRVIRYVITARGPEPALPGRELPSDIDHEHYLEKVLRPIADAILVDLGQSFDEALGNPRQLDLWPSRDTPG